MVDNNHIESSDVTVYWTQSNPIKGLRPKEYEALRERCRYAQHLYTVGWYSIRQYFWGEGRCLRDESNDPAVKDNANYALLQAGVSPPSLTDVDRSVRSCFNRLTKAKTGASRYYDVRSPHYLDQPDYFPLSLSPHTILMKDGARQVPLSRAFQRLHPELARMRIPVPARLAHQTIQEVRIIPMEKARFFTVQCVYEGEGEPPSVSAAPALAIDLGGDNRAPYVNRTDGASFIIDGQSLKSLTHPYNKRMAQLRSIRDQPKYPRSEQMARMTRNRHRPVHDSLMESARDIGTYGLAQGIGQIVAGYNPDWKRDVNMARKRNNPNFVQIPHGQLRNQLDNRCPRYGIRYVGQEESYPSKASVLDHDSIPLWNGPHHEVSFRGKRVPLGVYRVSDHRVLNADVNGAAHIPRQSNHRLDVARAGRGLLANPLRVQLI